jgi:hypothetical protein
VHVYSTEIRFCHRIGKAQLLRATTALHQMHSKLCLQVEMQSKDGDDAQRLLDALQPLWHGGSSTARKGGKRKRGGSQPRSSKVRNMRPVSLCTVAAASFVSCMGRRFRSFCSGCGIFVRHVFYGSYQRSVNLALISDHDGCGVNVLLQGSGFKRDGAAGTSDSAASSAADSGAGGGSADGEEGDEAETPPRPQRRRTARSS